MLKLANSGAALILFSWSYCSVAAYEDTEFFRVSEFSEEGYLMHIRSERLNAGILSHS